MRKPGKKAAAPQLDLFKIEPVVRGEVNMSGRDIYKCPVRGFWTTDSDDLQLTDEQRRIKYGPSTECPPGGSLTYWQKTGYWFAYGGEEPELD